MKIISVLMNPGNPWSGTIIVRPRWIKDMLSFLGLGLAVEFQFTRKASCVNIVNLGIYLRGGNDTADIDRSSERL